MRIWRWNKSCDPMRIWRWNKSCIMGVAGVAVLLISVIFVATHGGLDVISALRLSNFTQIFVPDAEDTLHVLQETADTSIAELLKKRVRVLIWVMTSPKTLEKARAVKNTWGTRCDLLLFFSSENNTEIPTIKLNVSEGREHLLEKSTQAFDYIYDNYFHQADWFMKVDDDTFVVMENLRYFLYDKNASEPLYTGRHFHEPKLKVNYNSGGAGYVLSKEALRRYGTRQGRPSVCTKESTDEDVQIGRCLETLGVRILNSTDNQLRSRFHPFEPVKHIVNGLPGNYQAYDANSAKMGIDAINEHAITYHYITPREMHVLYYYIYHFRLFGISYLYGGSTETKS